MDLVDVEDVANPGAIAAAPCAVLLLATTVIALAFAAAPAADAEVELVGSPAAMDVAFPFPATTVTPPVAAVPDDAILVELAPPLPASTVTALPTLLVVVPATRPSWVRPEVLIDAAAEVVEFAAFAPLPVPPDAMTVIAAAADVPAAVVFAAAVDFPPLFWVEPSSESWSDDSASVAYA